MIISLERERFFKLNPKFLPYVSGLVSRLFQNYQCNAMGRAQSQTSQSLRTSKIDCFQRLEHRFVGHFCSFFAKESLKNCLRDYFHIGKPSKRHSTRKLPKRLGIDQTPIPNRYTVILAISEYLENDCWIDFYQFLQKH